MLRHASPRVPYAPLVHLPRRRRVRGDRVAGGRNVSSHANLADGGLGSGRHGVCSARRQEDGGELLVPAVPRGGGGASQKLRDAVGVKARAASGERANMGDKHFGLGEDVPKALATGMQNLRAVPKRVGEEAASKPELAAGGRRERNVLPESAGEAWGAVKERVGRTGGNGGPGPRDIKSRSKALAEAAPDSPPRFTVVGRALQLSGPAPPPGTIPGLASLKRRVLAMPPLPRRLSRDLFWDRPETHACVCARFPKKKPGSQKTTPKGATGEKGKKEEKEEAPPSRAEKRAFNKKKQALAEAFLKKVDKKVGKGEVGKACEHDGGVKIVWTKVLRTAAGTAWWKVDRYEGSDGRICLVKHYATVELSNRIIDNELKMHNVLCHEYCHLANCVIDETRERGHGREFKKWAKRCSDAFSHLGVNVTVRHSYPIPRRYWWVCQKPGCGTNYARMTQSIDPEKMNCLICKTGKLVQTKPPPREKRPLTGYQAFVKDNFARVRAENQNVPTKEVLGLVAAEYRESKAGSKREKTEEPKEPVEAGGEEGEEEGGEEEEVEKEDGEEEAGKKGEGEKEEGGKEEGG